MKISRSAFYDWFKKSLTRREQEGRTLAERIRKLFFESSRTYGHRRIRKKLRKDGIRCGNDRIRCLMRGMHPVPVQARRYKATGY